MYWIKADCFSMSTIYIIMETRVVGIVEGSAPIEDTQYF